MRKIVIVSAAVLAAAAGVAGTWFDVEPFATNGWLWLFGGCATLLLAAVELTYRPAGTGWPDAPGPPRPLRLRPIDYAKALVQWIHAFKRTYAIEPGLYHLSDDVDVHTPVLVTGNYHLSVFLLLRHLQGRNVRLLVVDTDGINVWCAAGKLQFSNDAILQQLERYDRAELTDRKWLRLVLPKFGLAGIDIRGLRKEKIRPIIGPLYAREVPAWLAAPKLVDQNESRVHFGLQMRLFSWLPGFVQFTGYSLGVALAFFLLVELPFGVHTPVGIVAVAAVMSTLYPVLFPWLWGQRFAVKGITLSAWLLLAVSWALSPAVAASAIPVVVATGIFTALAYTGNSAVSNYSRVRREIAAYLPACVILYVVSEATIISDEVLR